MGTPRMLVLVEFPPVTIRYTYACWKNEIINLSTTKAKTWQDGKNGSSKCFSPFGPGHLSALRGGRAAAGLSSSRPGRGSRHTSSQAVVRLSVVVCVGGGGGVSCRSCVDVPRHRREGGNQRRENRPKRSKSIVRSASLTEVGDVCSTR